MSPAERLQHDMAMVELEKQVDLAMLKVITTSRMIADQLNEDVSPDATHITVSREHLQRLKDVIKEADKSRLDWLEEARKSWSKS